MVTKADYAEIVAIAPKCTNSCKRRYLFFWLHRLRDLLKSTYSRRVWSKVVLSPRDRNEGVALPTRTNFLL